MANPICPTGCESDLPDFSFSDCAPEIETSEVHKVYLGKPGVGFTGTGALTISEFNARLNATDDTKIIELVVAGDLGLPEELGVREINGNLGIIRVSSGNRYTMNITIEQVTQQNYQAMRTLQCAGAYQMWFKTYQGKYLYGGREGIPATASLNPNFQRGKDNIIQLDGTVSWIDRFAPERILHPAA